LIIISIVLFQDPEGGKLSPYWVTGFADAESTFVIRVSKTNRKQCWRILPIFSIELHIKDISLLRQILYFFGVGTIIIRKRKGRTTGIFSVQSIKDLNDVIIPHFIKYTLLTKKRIDFQIFCLIIDLMNKKEHLNLKGISEIIGLKNFMNKGLSEKLKKAFPSPTRMGDLNLERTNISLCKKSTSVDFYPEIKDPQWLTGFVDGEGCFYVKIRKSILRKSQVSLVFSISQHARDLLLFTHIKNYLGCGIIEQISTRRNAVFLVVYNYNDILNKIIPFFEKYSLMSAKLLDYQDFYKVAFMIKEKIHLTEEGIYNICQIKSNMNKGRK